MISHIKDFFTSIARVLSPTVLEVWDVQREMKGTVLKTVPDMTEYGMISEFTYMCKYEVLWDDGRITSVPTWCFVWRNKRWELP